MGDDMISNGFVIVERKHQLPVEPRTQPKPKYNEVCINHARWVLDDGCPARGNIHKDSPCYTLMHPRATRDLKAFHNGTLTLSDFRKKWNTNHKGSGIGEFS